MGRSARLRAWGLSTPTTANVPAWMRKAACVGEPLTTFFPGGRDGALIAEAIKRAKRICAGCPVRTACLDWAIEHQERYGIWGGTTAEERQRERRRRSRAPHVMQARAA